MAVFGASGFLGAHLVRALVPIAAHVVAFARGTASPALSALDGAEVVLGDIRNRADVEIASRNAEVIFMMAGRSGAVASLQDPQSDLLTNCSGLLNVLEVVRAQPNPARIIFPGSRLQYGKANRLPVSEDDELQPLVPYGLHKTFCERYLRYYWDRFKVPYGVARLTNPYGPWPAPFFRGYNVLNLMVLKALNNEDVNVYGDGNQLRDYVYVDDAVELLLHLGTHDQNVTVNCGSGEGHRIVEVAERIVRLAGAGRVRHLPWPEPALSVETGDFVADISRARALGWAPKFALDDGLRHAIAQARGDT